MSDIFYMWGAKGGGYSFHETNPGQPLVTDRALAQRFAESFATRLNEKNHMQINTWKPMVELKEHRPGTPWIQ